MKTNRVVMGALVLALAGSGAALDAQQAREGRRAAVRAEGARVARAPIGVETLLRAGERLELTDAQRTALREVQARSRDARDRAEDARIQLRRDVRDGDITLTEMRERARALAEEQRASRLQIGDEVREVLTEEQRGVLERSVARRAMARRVERTRPDRGVERTRPGPGIDRDRMRRGRQTERVRRGVPGRGGVSGR